MALRRLTVQPAKLISRKGHLIPGMSLDIAAAGHREEEKKGNDIADHRGIGQFYVQELFFEVPKDHAKPEAGTLTLFGRCVTKYERPIVGPSVLEGASPEPKPYFVCTYALYSPLRCSRRPVAALEPSASGGDDPRGIQSSESMSTSEK